MKPGTYAILLEEGVGFTRRMTWRSAGVVVPLADWSARLDIRHPDNVGEYLLTLTSEPGGGIILADTAPNITIEITEEQSHLGFTRTAHRFVLTPPAGTGQSFPLLKGPVELEMW